MLKIRQIIAVLTAAAMITVSAPINAGAVSSTTRYMEALDRGLVAMMTDSGVYLTWRLLGTEAYNTTFDVYRDGTKIASAISDSTDYLDASGTSNSVYKVVASTETAAAVTKTATAFSSGKNYLEIPVAPLEDYVAPDGTVYEYKIHDASVGDVDGDGEYEIIVKREANHQHAAAYASVDGKNQLVSVFGHQYIEAYKLDGTILWRLDMGVNCRPMTEFVFLVYDFNGDGAAEIACKTAPGAKDGTGAYVSEAGNGLSIIPDENGHTGNDVDYRTNPSSGYYKGYIEYGSEWFTLFDGRNGQALDTIEYPMLRGTDENNTYNNQMWVGSSNGDGTHRGEKCMGVVSYFDGENPGIGLWRGIYYGKGGETTGRTAAANISVNKTTNKMTVVNRFDTYSGLDGYKSGYEKYIGQGNHSIAVGDVDNDGKDEMMSGGLCLDDNLSPLWCTYRGHGDAHHLGDYDPINDGLEYLTVQEESAIHDKDGTVTTSNPTSITNDFGEQIIIDHGMTLVNAANGKELFHVDDSKDTGRGMMANTGQGGYYQITGASEVGTYIVGDGEGEARFTKSSTTSGMNFRIFWDGDLYDELFDSYNPGSDYRPTITDYNKSTNTYETIFCDDDTVTINGTKSAPLLQADIFGDWREELVLKTADDMAMRIYTTNIPTDNKLYTLMHDSLYRQGVALQNQYYNQPPHIGYYVCEESDALYNSEYDKRSEQPDITTVTYSGTAPSATAMPVESGVKERNNSYIIDEDGDYYSGVNDTSPASEGWTAETSGIGRQVLMSTTNDVNYLAAAADKSYLKNYSGKFLLFSANGADTKFETTSESSVSGTGKLKFSFLIPSTFSDNGSFAYGNAPTTMYVGDGTNNALEFTVTPNVSNGYVQAAILSVNGTDICSYSSFGDAQSWTDVECAIDNTNKKAYIAVTKADGKIYTADVSYADSSCANPDTFGVDASKYYGTIALDEIKLYSTGSLEKPSASATDSYSPVPFATKNPQTEYFYKLDVTDIGSGQITQKVKTSEAKSDASKYNMANFRTATLKTAAVPELDGWGYVHAAYDNTAGRQTAASVDADSNSVIINGTNNVGGAAISFIPKNLEGKTMPTTGTLTYTFTAVVSKAAGSVGGTVNYGFTSSADGSNVASVEAAAISNSSDNDYVKEAAVVMTYDLDTKAYSITVDGEEKASGTSSAITGIYAQSVKNSYTNGEIRDLVLDASDYVAPTAAPIITPTPNPYVTEYTFGSSFNEIKAFYTNSLDTETAISDTGLTLTTSVKTNYNNAVIMNQTTKAGTGYYPYSTGLSDPDEGYYLFLGSGGNNGSNKFTIKFPDTIPSGSTVTIKFAKPYSTNNGTANRSETAGRDTTNTVTIGSSTLDIEAGYDYDTWSEYTFNLTSDASEMVFAQGAWSSIAIASITVEKPEPTPTPTASPSPTPTAAPPTQAPISVPTRMPAATDKPNVTPTDIPTATDKPNVTPTDVPAATDKPNVTPTEVPAATDKPNVTPTDVPAATDKPTAVPTGVPTSTPDSTPAPTGDPSATTAPSDVFRLSPIGQYTGKINGELKKSDDKVTVTITAADANSEKLPSVTLYLAEYNNDGFLTALKTGTAEYDDNVIIITSGLPKTDNYKFMLWDKDMCPLIEVISDIK